MLVMLGSFTQSTAPPYPIRHPWPPARRSDGPRGELGRLLKGPSSCGAGSARGTSHRAETVPPGGISTVRSSSRVVLGCARCHLAPSR